MVRSAEDRWPVCSRCPDEPGDPGIARDDAQRLSRLARPQIDESLGDFRLRPVDPQGYAVPRLPYNRYHGIAERYRDQEHSGADSNATQSLAAETPGCEGNGQDARIVEEGAAPG